MRERSQPGRLCIAGARGCAGMFPSGGSPAWGTDAQSRFGLALGSEEEILEKTRKTQEGS